MNELMNIQTMSSREIAEISNRPHNDVLKAIRAMEHAWKKVTGGNFSPSEYKDSTGRTLPMYKLNKKECLYVATKFNDEARAKLILRWEELETKPTKPMTAAEQLLASVQLMVEQEKRMNAVEDKVKMIDARTTTRIDEFTIAGYATLNGMHVGVQLASKLGRRASKLCNERGIHTGKIHDPRFGEVKTYPASILEEVFEMNIIK